MYTTRNDLVADLTYGISDVLAVKPGQTITEYNPERFKEIIIRKDPITNETGTLVIIQDGVSSIITDEDLIVASDVTIEGDVRSYRDVIFTPGNTLTVN